MLYPLMLAAVMAAFRTKTIPHIALAQPAGGHSLSTRRDARKKNPLLAAMAFSLPMVAVAGLIFLPGRSTCAPTETS
jgi:hypothetical protein